MRPNKVVYFTKTGVPEADENTDLDQLELLTKAPVHLIVASADDNAKYDPNLIDADYYISQDGSTAAEGYEGENVTDLATVAGDLGDLQLADDEALATDEDDITVTDQLETSATASLEVSDLTIKAGVLDDQHIIVKLGDDIEAEDGSKVKITLGGDGNDEITITYTPAP